jgi:hypothetical protein
LLWRNQPSPLICADIYPPISHTLVAVFPLAVVGAIPIVCSVALKSSSRDFLIAVDFLLLSEGVGFDFCVLPLPDKGEDLVG